MSLDNNSHSVFLFDSGYEIWQKELDDKMSERTKEIFEI